MLPESQTGLRSPARARKIVAPSSVVLLAFTLHACTNAPPIPNPTLGKYLTPTAGFPTPETWATPGGLETEIAGLQTEMAHLDLTQTALAVIDENEKNPDATPMPGSSMREVISICIDGKKPEACVYPIPLDEAKQRTVDWYSLLFENNNSPYLSPSSYAEILSILDVLYQALDDYQKGVPGSIPIYPYVSLFGEASGGLTTMNQVGKGIFSHKPEIFLYQPQVPVLKNSMYLQHAGIEIHENYHAAKAIENWKTNHTFETPSVQFDDQEELSAEFYGDVAEIYLAKLTGAINEPSYLKEVKDDLLDEGSYLPYIAWYLDSQGVAPDSPLWKLYYETHSWYSYQTNVDLYGNAYGDSDQLQKLQKKWEEYPWTPAEIELFKGMVSDGIDQGWISSIHAFPSLP